MKFFSKIEICFNFGCLIFMFFVFLALPVGVFSETSPFFRGLGVGSKGLDVLLLQQFLNSDPDTVVAFYGAGSPGLETDRFGSLTRLAVNKFQKKYSDEILFAGQAPTGYVGPKTLRKLDALYKERIADSPPPDPVSTTVPAISEPLPQTLPPSQGVAQPEVYSVSPNRVKAGDTVTVTGKNFTPTDNTVFLRYAYIEARFDNLSSADGKTIVFTYEPPKVRTMTRGELLSMPSNILNQILGPVEVAGGSIDDLLAPYREMKDENELKEFFNNTGNSFDDLYDYFYVIVENARGSGSSQAAILWGLRELRFGRDALSGNSFFTRVASLFENFILTPKAYAQGNTPEGGWNSGIIMYCTCSGGFLTFMMDYSTNGGTGLYYFSAGFRPRVGTGMISAPHLGFFKKNEGKCKIYAGKSCITITANIPVNPWGAAI